MTGLALLGMVLVAVVAYLAWSLCRAADLSARLELEWELRRLRVERDLARPSSISELTAPSGWAEEWREYVDALPETSEVEA